MKNNFMSLFEKCNEELKTLAFTHSSYANEHKTKSNERIEFLGDSVLSIIVSDYLYKNHNQTEGKMSKVRSTFVCAENLSQIAKQLKIEDRILFGKSFKGKDVSNSILADTIESMIGAIYLSFGLNSISSSVLEILNIKEKIKSGLKPSDFKSALQEYAQDKKHTLKYTAEKYLTKGGQENFRATVFVNDEFVAYGQGSSKREAEQNGAKLAMKKLNKQSD